MSDSDITTMVYLMWGFLGLIISYGAYTTLTMKNVLLSKKAKWLISAMLISWLGAALNKLWFGGWFILAGLISTDWSSYVWPLWIFSAMVILGGLIYSQTLLGWKYGRFTWLKVFMIISTLSYLLISLPHLF